LATSSPGADPLEVLKQECIRRKLCDAAGFRLSDVHWTFSIAVTSEDTTNMPPNLRTIGVQRISEQGIDFVVKRGSGPSKAFAAGRPVSILHLQGKYVAGEHAEQWRGEGHCETLPLQDIVHVIPHYTITGMMAARRIANEKSAVDSGVSMMMMLFISCFAWILLILALHL
jgi:hypothetical protein